MQSDGRIGLDWLIEKYWQTADRTHAATKLTINGFQPSNTVIEMSRAIRWMSKWVELQIDTATRPISPVQLILGWNMIKAIRRSELTTTMYWATTSQTNIRSCLHIMLSSRRLWFKHMRWFKWMHRNLTTIKSSSCSQSEWKRNQSSVSNVCPHWKPVWRNCHVSNDQADEIRTEI